ncbi:MAG: phospholipid/cholesterol/gamma-HCH transport system substrate-binding protein [Mycobacterium sp.]|nr:phospholipid/cholesterol/gamma-HCH transport system substrate-binding protein [Mycobacterium sp.]
MVGLAAAVVIVGVFATAGTMFRGGFTERARITVLSPRAGLVMDPEAKVKLHGAEVGRVASIEALPNGQAALHLAMDPSALQLIPSNVLVDIASTTIFGAKFVQLIDPAEPSPRTMQAGQVIEAQHVTVEINTVFQQLTAVLSTIEPVKLNQTLGAIATALNGRGHKFGQMLSDLNSLLAELDPSLPALSRDMSVAPEAFTAYADAAPDLIRIADNATAISQTILDERHNLDTLLVSVIGLADIGNDVVGGHRHALTDVLHLLVPTTDLTSRYHDALNCALAGIVPVTKSPPSPEPGVVASVSLLLGQERYRYPGDLPRVAATGGPQCHDLPKLGFGQHPPFVVADVGANPWKYGNQGLLLNADGLKQLLFGPLDGPPRNTAQIGQPG